ncbi:MAG: glycosyltransferase family 87 protein [Acidocella sp.]|nr:glycosyltransferase family 87 protein [Acidocella sp.]
MSRRLAWAATALALLAGGALFLLGLWAQGLRLWLYLRHGLGFADPFCTTGYCDYSMFWLAGTFAQHGQAPLLYDHARYAALAAQLLPYKTGWWPFVYPPPILLPASIIAALPLAAGYYLVSLLLLLASIALLRRAGIPGWCIGAGLISFPAMWNLYLGQFGLVCGALLVFGLSRLRTRPMLAGGALSLLAIKPQYALLVPVAVLAARQWRAVAAGAVGVVALLGFGWALGGGAMFSAYLGPGHTAMHTLLTQPPSAQGYQAMGSSVFWLLRGLHLGVAAAYAGQGLISTACALLVWQRWRQGETPLAATVFCTLLASPYGFTDDLAIYAVLMPTLARRAMPWRNAALAWLWVLPAFTPKIYAHTGVLITPLLLLAALRLSLAEKEQPLLAKQIGQLA